MNIVLLYSLAISTTLCSSTELDKESLQSIYDLLPDPFWEQVKYNQEEYGEDAYYHKARMILMLKILILMLLQNRSHSYLIRYAV